MATVTFDTHSFIKRLTAAGMPIEQAEALAEAFTANLGELVTKEYLKNELERLEQRLIIKLGGMLVVGLSVLGVILKLT